MENKDDVFVGFNLQGGFWSTSDVTVREAIQDYLNKLNDKDLFEHELQTGKLVVNVISKEEAIALQEGKQNEA